MNLELVFDYYWNTEYSPPRLEFSLGWRTPEHHRIACNYVPDYLSTEDILSALKKLITSVNDDIKDMTIEHSI